MAVNIIHEDLDVFRYIKALSDIEKLKRLLLDDEQRQLFDFKQKQDVIVRKNLNGQIVCHKGFNLESNSIVSTVNEPDALVPAPIQLEIYQKVWKTLVKLRK